MMVGLVGIAAAFVLFGGVNTANAQSVSDLQDQINALLAQIAGLQGGSSSSAGCYAFTRDLTEGSTGADVTALQNYLATTGHFSVAATGFFGPITRTAVASWQAANGVSPAAGYFGAISRAKYNMVCTPTTGGGSGDDDGGFEPGSGDEASLEDYDASDGEDTDVEEGAEGQEIMEFEFDVEDSDVELQRVEVTFEFTGTAAGEDEPWDVFEGATLMMGGDEIASVDDLDDEDVWDEEGTDTYSFRFNNIDEVIEEGDTAEFILAVDVASGIDGIETAGANTWDVYIADEGIRALDEAGIDQYTGDDAAAEQIDIDLEEAGADNELNLSESDDNPEATTLEVDEDDRSDWHSVALMELSADGNIVLDDFIFNVMINEDGTPADETYDDVINDLMLVIDGEEYDDFSVSGNTTATATVTFDLDSDVVIEDGEDVEVEVMAEFKALTGNYDEGTTVTINASSTVFESIDAEGEEDGESLAAGQLEGSFEGESHTLRSEGFSVVFVDGDAESPVGSTESRADYFIEFTVTSFGDDFFVPKTTVDSATASTTVGVTFKLMDSEGTTYTSTTTAALTVASSVSGDTSTHFKVSDGQTRTFTLDVSLDNLNGTTGFYEAQLVSIGFDTDTAQGGESTVGASELEEFDTGVVQVQNANVD